MTQNKTQATQQSVADFVTNVEPERRRKDAETLVPFFRDVTGFEPVMWGSSIIGYGRYHYVYASGREGDFLATGFSPRKSALSIYIMPGYTDFGNVLERLGKHKIGKSCLYINKLDDVDMNVLAELVHAGLADLATRWTVHPS
ncbi:DUF1801 domain-containing protein [Roseovarius phycicola]|uniref:DUF1801 domain-containing protein n=1 Tax=Roseovarius phycicola TaxID=3080976 RepID=A0ABZ2HFS2_9RHOB